MPALKSLLSSLFIAPLCLALSACSSGPGEEEFAPQINEIYSSVAHRHPSFYEKWPTDIQSTIDLRFSVSISDPQGIGDLLLVYVRDINGSITYPLFDAKFNNPFSFCYSGAGIFECPFPTKAPYNSANLKNFEVVVQDRNGYIRRKPFNLLLAGGEQPEQETFVYSDTYTEDTTNGYAALEVLTIEDNGMVFTADPGTQSFHIEFETFDSRAKYYSLDFYDNEVNVSAVGSASQLSSTIQSHPIVIGQKTVLDLPWSEINFNDGFSVDNIKHLHISLYDSPISWDITDINIGLWFNHMATSEEISLAD